MSVHLYLMRHAEPQAGHPMDATRQLTKQGKQQAAQMAAWLRNEIGRVDIVICSPFARAIETAQTMNDALGSHIATTRLLEPDCEPPETWKEVERLAQASKHILIVGHDPNINLFLAWLINGGGVRFEHGAIAYVKMHKVQTDVEQIVSKLHWLVDPKLVAREEESELLEAAVEFAEALNS